eukprot:gene20002-25975_t
MNIPRVKGGYPFFGQVFKMVSGSPWDTMTEWSRIYGSIYQFHLFGSDAVVVSDPELLRIILSTKLSIFKKDLQWTYKPFLVLLGNGIVTADGLSWRRQRTLLSSHLRIDILEYIPDMAFRAFKRFQIRLDKAKLKNEALDMAEEFRHLTLQVISEALLSLSPKESDETFAKMYLPIVEEGNNRTWSPQRMYLPFPSWFQFNKDVKVLNDYVTSLIVKRWALKKSEKNISHISRQLDILDKILEPVTEKDWNSNNISQIRDEIKTFVLAGHETSASMLTWTLFELSKNPNYLNRVINEANATFGESGDILPNRSTISDGLRFTECCLKESLRKYSIVPSVVRVASEAVDLGQYHIPKGMTIMIGIQNAHHDPANWTDPLVYKPERFLEETKPYTFLPFIDGPRMCLGQYLSLLETTIVLSLLVSTYKFEIANLTEASMRHPFMVPIIPKNGHKMFIH